AERWLEILPPVSDSATATRMLCSVQKPERRSAMRVALLSCSSKLDTCVLYSESGGPGPGGEREQRRHLPVPGRNEPRLTGARTSTMPCCPWRLYTPSGVRSGNSSTWHHRLRPHGRGCGIRNAHSSAPSSLSHIRSCRTSRTPVRG